MAFHGIRSDKGACGRSDWASYIKTFTSSEVNILFGIEQFLDVIFLCWDSLLAVTWFVWYSTAAVYSCCLSSFSQWPSGAGFIVSPIWGGDSKGMKTLGDFPVIWIVFGFSCPWSTFSNSKLHCYLLSNVLNDVFLDLHVYFMPNLIKKSSWRSLSSFHKDKILSLCLYHFPINFSCSFYRLW